MRALGTALLVVSALACQKAPAPPPSSSAQATPGLPPAPASAAMPAAPAPAPAPSSGDITGKVLERIDAPPYSYLRLETAAGEEWAAVSQTTVEAGAQVTVTGTSRMDGFESKTLGRRFDRIVFGSLADQPAAAATPPAPAAAPAARVAPPEGGTSIADVYAKKDGLRDREVVIRGTVVKYNAGILGKNWLHLRDGSGSDAAGDHDVTVTTLDSARVGETVTARGTVRVDKDLGAGYKFAVLVEDARLAR
jgi:hypothetical protein